MIIYNLYKVIIYNYLLINNMIIHHSENINNIKINFGKYLKYSDNFTFIPINNCIFQTPLLFTPYGIQETQNKKQIIDLSFQNKDNDKSLMNFLRTLKIIYKSIYNKYKNNYKINNFLKETEYNECIRLKLSSNMIIFDENKNELSKIDRFTYGNFIIQLNGLWINNNDIWFQWILLQSKIKIPYHLKEYSFIDEKKDNKDNKDNIPDKYDKMIKMGVPLEAVKRQKLFDGIIPPPPPLINNNNNNKSFDIPKIKASDLQSVVLKKGKKINKLKSKSNGFEPPSLEELQTTLSKLKKIKK
jgi:hypothetical protein